MTSDSARLPPLDDIYKGFWLCGYGRHDDDERILAAISDEWLELSEYIQGRPAELEVVAGMAASLAAAAIAAQGFEADPTMPVLIMVVSTIEPNGFEIDEDVLLHVVDSMGKLARYGAVWGKPSIRKMIYRSLTMHMEPRGTQ